MKKMMSLILLLSLTACQEKANDSWVIPPSISSDKSSAIVGGFEVAEDDPLTKSVFLLRQIYEVQIDLDGVPSSKLTSFRCTATALNSHILLTAAHCVSPNAISHRIEFHDGNGDLQMIDASHVEIHPPVNEQAVDLALVILNESLPEDTIFASLPERDLTLETKQILAAGYGTTSQTPGVRADGVLRAVDLQLVGLENDSNTFIVDQQERKGICSGDSGGPALLVEAEQLTLLGVASEVSSLENEAKEVCNHQGYYVNIFKNLEWITARMGQTKAVITQEEKPVQEENSDLTR